MALHRLDMDDWNSAEPARAGARRILVVDDSQAQRHLLRTSLGRLGYSVAEAACAMEALKLLEQGNVDIVVSDWMMPGMDGLEFCQRVRGMDHDAYRYFILLTSKDDKEAVARGLDVGADDFLTKPVALNELRARIAAGERILDMQHELSAKNRLVTSTLAKISSLYDSLDRDLIEARKLQQSLVRERNHDFGAARVSLILRPSGHVGGDLVGCFPVGDTGAGFYSIDVSGHGVASALMTARLAAYLSGGSPDRNVALSFDEGGSIVARSPAAVAEHLNRMMLKEMQTDLYFTMVLGMVDFGSATLNLVQCGHPHALLQRGGSIEQIGIGGLPIGLFFDGGFEATEVPLRAGDRIFFHSDGASECVGPGGRMFGEVALCGSLARNSELDGTSLLEALMWELSEFCGDQPFSDDISALVCDFDTKVRRMRP